MIERVVFDNNIIFKIVWEKAFLGMFTFAFGINEHDKDEWIIFRVTNSGHLYDDYEILHLGYFSSSENYEEILQNEMKKEMKKVLMARFKMGFLSIKDLEQWKRNILEKDNNK